MASYYGEEPVRDLRNDNNKEKMSVGGLDSRLKLAVEEIIKLEDLAKKFFLDVAQKDKEIWKIV